MSCPSKLEMIGLVDLQTHMDECGACADEVRALRDLTTRLAAPVGTAKVAAVMRRLDEEPTALRPRRSRLWIAVPVVAVAAAALLVFAPTRERFTARGVGVSIGVTLHRLDGRLVPLGTTLPRTAALVASYRNMGGTAYLMIYAEDAAGVLHWLYPGWTDPSTDPQSVELMTTQDERLMAETVVLDDPAVGRMRLITVVTKQPIRVSHIERRLPLPVGAAVEEVVVEVTP